MMKLVLTKTDVEKILSSMDAEEIEEKLEASYIYWEVRCEASNPFQLSKKEKEVKPAETYTNGERKDRPKR